MDIARQLVSPHHPLWGMPFPHRPLGTGPRALSGTAEGKWPGVSAQAWIREGQLADRPPADFGDARRVLVVTPHDDDLVGVGGLIQRATAADVPVRLVTICGRLADDANDARRRSRNQAITDLGIAWPKLQYLGLPSGRLYEHERALTEGLRRLVRPGDLVVTTWWLDGCRDHEVAGRAACVAAAPLDLPVWGAAVWLWHWARPTNPIIPWSRVRAHWLSREERTAKEAALRTQRDGRVIGGPDDRILEPVRLKRSLNLPEMFMVGARRR